MIESKTERRRKQASSQRGAPRKLFLSYAKTSLFTRGLPKRVAKNGTDMVTGSGRVSAVRNATMKYRQQPSFTVLNEHSGVLCIICSSYTSQLKCKLAIFLQYKWYRFSLSPNRIFLRRNASGRSFFSPFAKHRYRMVFTSVGMPKSDAQTTKKDKRLSRTISLVYRYIFRLRCFLVRTLVLRH